MNIIIAGAGLTGLSAALELSKYQVTLIDAKQEIGTPSRSPGLIDDDSLLISGIKDKIQYNNGCFRRSWLEKSMAIRAIEQGVDIMLKTRISGFDEGLILKGPNVKDSDKLVGDVYIDLLGEKTVYSGWPGESKILRNHDIIRPPSRKLYSWEGGISISGYENTRADGTGEVWWRDEPPFHPKEGWLERMSGEHPSNISADAAILRGIECAEKIV